MAEGFPGALGLLDDAAVLSLPPGEELVVTADALVEGVHFLPDDALDLVARKALRVNLSDLAAKAAEPFAYLLTVAWSSRCGWPEREAFAAGLAQDQAEFGVSLSGGDTVATPGPLTVSITAFGRVPAGRMLRRSGGRAGDLLLVSGTIGDGGLGLQAARGDLGGAEALADRYRLPQPRLALRDALRRGATAAADVSDGLLADAGRVAAASGLRAVVDLDRLPLSAEARAWAVDRPREEAVAYLASAGDDYEIVCAAAPDRAPLLQAAAAEAGLPLTPVGRLELGEGVEARLDGRPLPLDRLGWRHG